MPTTENDYWFAAGYNDARKCLHKSSQGGQAYRDGWDKGKWELEAAGEQINAPMSPDASKPDALSAEAQHHGITSAPE